MKQKNFNRKKIVSLLLFMLLMSVLFWLPSSFIEWWYQQVEGVNLFHILSWFFSSFFLFVLVHEMAHALAFIIQGINIRAIYLVFFVIYKDTKWHIKISTSLLKLMGGLVFPDIHTIHDQNTYQKVLKALRISLLAAPITSWLWLLFIIFIWQTSLAGMIQNELFYMMIFTIVWTLIYSVTFFVKTEVALGDIKAFIELKKTSHFQVIQILQITKFSSHQDHQTLYFLGTLNRLYLQNSTQFHLLEQMALQYEIAFVRNTILKPDVTIKNWAKKAPFSRLYHSKYDRELAYQVIIYLRQLKLDEEASKLYLRQPKKLNEDQQYALNKLNHIMFGVEVDIHHLKVYDNEIGALFLFDVLVDPQSYIKEQYQTIQFSPWICNI
jgi:hypothetical protein